MKWHITIPYSRPLLNLFYYNQWPGAWALVSLSNASYSGAAIIRQRGGGGGGSGGSTMTEQKESVRGGCPTVVIYFLLLQIRVWKQHFLAHAWHAIIGGGGGGVRLCEVSYQSHNPFIFFIFFFTPINRGRGMPVTVVQPWFVRGGGGEPWGKARERSVRAGVRAVIERFTPPTVGIIVKIRTRKRHFLAR